MEKEEWMQEFEKKQSRKRGYEEEEDVAGEKNDRQFFRMAGKTLMRMTSKDDTVVNFPDVTESVTSEKLCLILFNLYRIW